MRKLSMDDLNRDSVEDFKNKKKIPLVLVLDNVRSLNNVGSVFRTADAFMVEKIYLCGITGTPPHRDIEKTALGATESVAWQHVPDTLELVKELKAQSYKIGSVEQAEQSIKLNAFQPETGHAYALVLGNEVFGVEQDVINHSDFVLEIPQFGTKHSLNISVATGVVVWDFLSKVMSQEV
ncbi:RNA methyltransferase [Pontibacter arcticus]|uniref:TrmH family RNA methyltransferase n=1 Tax=Pontibacter arcticus TaxID=2080288 RepID=A0A364RI97_9BACT|nr:RNA methyltransferase [Pontibacter arcticus]RAU83994.1 TrmH family RNA methyltransferase [Pontibacter arcticus]